MRRLAWRAAAMAVLALGACHAQQQAHAPIVAATPPTAHHAAAQLPAAPAPGPLTAQAIDQAAFVPQPPGAAPPSPSAQTPPDPALIRAEVLLGRAGFSPGAIDGRAGSNLRKAVAAYQTSQGLPANGRLNAATFSRLTRDPRPAMAIYTVSAQDAGGPFAPDVGEDFVKLAALPEGPQYTSPAQELAERFHMSQALLAALNPSADLSKPGTVLLVTAPDAPMLGRGQVARIVVSKTKDQVRAFARDGALLAVYPATVGSTELPSPHGRHKVKGVSFGPTYVYDPRKLHWGPRKHGKLVIKPGPNSPVGVAWIDLDAPSYGIHGTPDPTKIGKTASHGCVRLTNWDALTLAQGVRPGVTVDFVG